MSIDIRLETPRRERFSESLSGNVREIAVQAKLYNALFAPGVYSAPNDLYNCAPEAGTLVNALQTGLNILIEHPETFRNESGLHDYLTLRGFVEKYLPACRKYPKALVIVT